MSTGNKRRRVSPSPNSQTTTRSNVDGDPLSRLTDLTTQVIEMAKLVKATPVKGAAVHKVRELADLLLLKVLPHDLIAYDVHKSWFQHHVDAFLNYCDQINVEGYEMDHMRREITRKIIKWLQKLWLCMVEEDADLGIIAKCFAVCSKSLERLDETVYHSITIVDLEGNTVYSDNKDIEQTLYWMWKELLVAACSRNAGRFISMKHVCQLIRQPGQTRNADSSDFWDEHWSDAMRAAGARFCVDRRQERLASFQEGPSYEAYQALISEFPALEPDAYAFIRSDCFSENPFILVEDAVRLFLEKSTSSTDDLVHLVRTDLISISETTQRDVLKHFSTQSSTDCRSQGLMIIGNGLIRAQREVLSAARYAFPELRGALTWLKESMQKHQLPTDFQLSFIRPQTEAQRKMDRLLHRFASLAVNHHDGGRGPLEEEPYMCGDSDEEEDELPSYERTPPDLVKNIREWILALSEWPHEQDKIALWDRVRRHHPLFFVHGAKRYLSSQCNRNGTYYFVAQGLDAMRKTFACKDLKELERYTPKRKDLGNGRSTITPVQY